MSDLTAKKLKKLVREGGGEMTLLDDEIHVLKSSVAIRERCACRSLEEFSEQWRAKLGIVQIVTDGVQQ